MRYFRQHVALALTLAALEIVAQPYQKVGIPDMKAPKKEPQIAPVAFISPEDLKARIAKNESLTIIDLRAQSSFEQSDKIIKGSFHTRVRKVVYRLREIPRDREIVTYCSCPADEAAIEAARQLQGGGFKRVEVLRGGWDAWLKAGGQVESRQKL